MESLAITIKKKWYRICEKLLEIKAEPKKVALGYSLGVFLGTTPFIGAKAVIALILTSIFKWNKVASVIGVFHFNLFTAPPFYGFAFLVGQWVLGSELVFHFPDTMSFKAVYSAFLGNSIIFFNLLIGGIILGVPMALAAYWISYKILTRLIPKQG